MILSSFQKTDDPGANWEFLNNLQRNILWLRPKREMRKEKEQNPEKKVVKWILTW